MKRTISVLTLIGVSLSTAVALGQQQQQWSGTYTPAMPNRADDVDNIGVAGQFVFGVERVTGVFFDRDKTSYTALGVETETTVKTTTVGIFGMSASEPLTPSSLPRLALDYLVTDGISLGGTLTYVSRSTDVDTVAGSAETSDDLGSASVFNVNPRVGYAFPFDETFGLWPRLGVAFASRNFESDNFDPGPPSVLVRQETTITTWQLTLDAMVYISPFSHFAIMLGPYVDIGLGGNYEATAGALTDERNANLLSFGASVAIVGYY